MLRRALSCWAFNFSEHRKEPPAEIVAALEWVAQKSLPISVLNDDPDTVLAALDASLSSWTGKTGWQRGRLWFLRS